MSCKHIIQRGCRKSTCSAWTQDETWRGFTDLEKVHRDISCGRTSK